MLKHTDWTIDDYIGNHLPFTCEVWTTHKDHKECVHIVLYSDYTTDVLDTTMKVLRECADTAEWSGNATIAFNDKTFLSSITSE